MAAEKVSQTRTASLLSFLVSPRLDVALRGSPPSGSSLESFSFALLVLRGASKQKNSLRICLSPSARPGGSSRTLSRTGQTNAQFQTHSVAHEGIYVLLSKMPRKRKFVYSSRIIMTKIVKIEVETILNTFF